MLVRFVDGSSQLCWLIFGWKISLHAHSAAARNARRNDRIPVRSFNQACAEVTLFLTPKTINRDRALIRWHGEIDSSQCALSPQHLVEPDNPALSRNELMPGLLTQIFENRIEQRVLKFPVR